MYENKKKKEERKKGIIKDKKKMKYLGRNILDEMGRGPKGENSFEQDK